MEINWEKVQEIASKSYCCGYCGNQVASEKGYFGSRTVSTRGGTREEVAAYVHICHKCNCPTFFHPNGGQYPGVVFGNSVKHIPERSINALYNEARGATAAGCYTAAVMCCRTLLMHIAVNKGADEGQHFQQYVNYLVEKHFVPPESEAWVDHIRSMGNKANHEIKIMQAEDAKELITFIEMILKFLYEYSTAMKEKTQPKAPNQSS